MLIFFIAAYIQLSDQTIITPYSQSSMCLENQYFQYSSLRCVNCGTGQVKSPDSLSCICSNGTRFLVNKGGPLITCENCAANEVTSVDGWKCVKCSTDGEFNSITKTCKPCSSGQVTVDRKEDGSLYATGRQKCISCREDTYPGLSERICKRCNQAVVSVTSTLASGVSCACPVGGRRSLGMLFAYIVALLFYMYLMYTNI